MTREMICEMKNASARRQNVNNSYRKEQRSQLGRNRYFEARPATIHLAGFQVGHTVSTKLEILNVSTTARRLHLIVPQNAQFRVRKFVKKGDIAPGMVTTGVQE